MKKFLQIIVIMFMFGFLFSCNNNNSSLAVQVSENSEKTSTENSATNSEEKIYIDVRTDAEWADGHVENAIHIPLADIQAGKNIDKIPKDIPVYVYCRSGNRSGQAVKFLSENYGFTNLYNA